VNELKIKINNILLSIIKGISGAKGIGKVPAARAKRLGNNAIKIAPSKPRVVAATNKVALTMEPVII